jgi:hypothetical protein
MCTVATATACTSGRTQHDARRSQGR